MDNAIEKAIEFFTELDKGKHIHGIPTPTGIIAELTVHKAKLDSLKEYVSNKANSYNPKDSEIIEIIKDHPEDNLFYKYHFEAYADILKKLEELDK